MFGVTPVSSGLARWTLLILLSILLGLALEALRLPAALLLGPMVAAILIAVRSLSVRPAKPLFYGAQGVLGCLMARSIDGGILETIGGHWALFGAVIVIIVAASVALGWTLARFRVLPGSVAIWGSSPGAASTMTLMAGAYGADMGLVAFMQYLRVLAIAVVASLATRFSIGAEATAPLADGLAPIDPQALAVTLGLAWGGAALGRLSRVPAGAILTPLILGAIGHGLGWVRIDLPAPLLAVSYALIGWNIGLSFTAPVVAHALRALPSVAASVMVQIGLCAILGLSLTHLAGVDPLTAYLATSPGGVDSVAIIAASAKVDVGFVMALQTARLLVVLALGPILARFMAGRLAP